MRPFWGIDPRAVNQADAPLVGVALLVVQVEDTGRYTGAVKYTAGQGDDGFQLIRKHQLLAHFALFTRMEEHALRKHYSTATIFRIHGFDHVLKPGEVCIGVRRAAPQISPILVRFKLSRSPLGHAEGRIGKHTVKSFDSAAFQKQRIAKRVSLFNLNIFRAVKIQIHAGNGRRRQVVLLTVDSTIGKAVIVHVADCLD